MKNNTIQEGCESYLKNVVPENVGQNQIKETENIFYAGAHWACSIMMNIGAKNISEEAGAMIFDGMIQECKQHVENNLKRG